MSYEIGMQFYDVRGSLGVTVSVEDRWLEKPMEKLVKRFFRTYAVAGYAKLDPKDYGVVEASSGEDLSEKTIREALGSSFELKVIVVKRERKARPFAKNENAENETSNDDSLVFLVFEQQHRNVPYCQYARARWRLRERRKRRGDKTPPQKEQPKKENKKRKPRGFYHGSRRQAPGAFFQKRGEGLGGHQLQESALSHRRAGSPLPARPRLHLRAHLSRAPENRQRQPDDQHRRHPHTKARKLAARRLRRETKTATFPLEEDDTQGCSVVVVGSSRVVTTFLSFAVVGVWSFFCVLIISRASRWIIL